MSGERRWPGIVCQLLLAVGAFAAVTAAIRPLVPWPTEYGLRAKIDYYERHRDRFDTLYIGSSLTQRAYKPDVIDADLAGSGIHQTSFNFGINGMGFYEVNNVLDEILADRSPRLATVVVETQSCSPDLKFAENKFETRGVFWHTLKQTAQVLLATWNVDAPWTDRCALGWSHVKQAARKLTNYAQGPRIAAALGGDDGVFTYLQPADLEQGQGYQDPATGHDPEDEAARKHFLNHLADFKVLVDAIEPGNRRKVEYSPAEAAIVRAQWDFIASHGLRVLSVVPPAVAPSAEANLMHAAGVIPDMLAFNLPARYPQLFTVGAHMDRGHLSRVGAEAFSHAFAAEFAAFLASGSAGRADPPGAAPPAVH